MELTSKLNPAQNPVQTAALNTEKAKALAAALAQIEKQFGKGTIMKLGAGEVIGHSAIQEGALRTATVTTKGPAEVLRIESEDLVDLLDEVPALRDAIA